MAMNKTKQNVAYKFRYYTQYFPQMHIIRV